MELFDLALPYLSVITPVISLFTLFLVILLFRSSRKRMEELLEELSEKNSALSEKVKNVATKDDLQFVNTQPIETEPITLSMPDYSNFATKDDLINLSNRISEIRDEIVSLVNMSKEISLKPKSALNGHKAEKELEVYEKIWQATGDLYFSVEKLQPTIDSPIGNESENERWKRKYDEVISNYQKLFREAENQRIFYPKELYEQLQIMLREVKNEVVLLESSLKWNDTMPIAERNKNSESLDKIRAEVEHIYDFMKGRLNQL
jgi:hypothetical protein